MSMGEGNFSGGGSVSWEVINSDGESGGGDEKKCKGKDRDPKGDDGSFAVFANGSLKFVLSATNGNAIRVVWGPEAVSALAESTVSASRAVVIGAESARVRSRGNVAGAAR
jgi:hypothetical protein